MHQGAHVFEKAQCTICSFGVKHPTTESNAILGTAIMSKESDKQKRRVNAVKKFMNGVLKNKKHMKTMTKLGLGFCVLAWNPFTGAVEAQNSRHFERFVKDKRWDKSIVQLLKDPESNSEWEDELATTGSAFKFKNAVVAKNAGDVVRLMSQKNMLALLNAMGAADLRRPILENLQKENPDKLAWEVHTYDGTKANSNFEEIMAENAFKEPTLGDKGSSSSTSGVYQLQPCQLTI